MALPYQKIMVTLDGSELAKQALPHARALAQQAHAELILMQLVPHIDELVAALHGLSMQLKAIDEQQQRLVDEASLALHRLAADCQLHHIAAKVVVDVGDPTHRILAYAEANQVDLIVMSTHGRTGVQRLVMGSVASKVLAASPCPVLLVRPT